MSYYNTTQETGSALAEFHAKAKTQEQKVLLCFRTKNKPLSPFMVADLLDFIYPITSIRRALTNLTKEGTLEKTDKKVKGQYGHREHLWRLAE